jgi:hypothetical protein
LILRERIDLSKEYVDEIGGTQDLHPLITSELEQLAITSAEVGRPGAYASGKDEIVFWLRCDTGNWHSGFGHHCISAQ